MLTLTEYTNVPGTLRSICRLMLPILVGKQQVSPIPCHSTTGIGVVPFPFATSLPSNLASVSLYPYLKTVDFSAIKNTDRSQVNFLNNIFELKQCTKCWKKKYQTDTKNVRRKHLVKKGYLIVKKVSNWFDSTGNFLFLERLEVNLLIKVFVDYGYFIP